MREIPDAVQRLDAVDNQSRGAGKRRHFKAVLATHIAPDAAGIR